VRAVIVTIIAFAALLLAGIPIFMHPPTGYTGVTYRNTGAFVQPLVIDVAPKSPAFRQGLRSGDVVSCLSFRDNPLLFYPSSGYVPGTPIRMCVLRSGERRDVQLLPTVRPPAAPYYRSDAMGGVRLGEFALYMLCAMLLVLGRRGPMTWFFFAYAVCVMPTDPGLQNLTILPPALYGLYAVVTDCWVMAAFPLLLAFAVTVPDDRPPPGWRTTVLRIAFVLVPFFAAAGFIAFAQPWFGISPEFANVVQVLGAVLVFLVLICRLATMRRDERARFAWAAFAIGWSVIIDCLSVGNIIPTRIALVVVCLYLVTPVVLLYAVLKRHVIDIRFVVSRSLVYAIITTVVVAVVGLVDWATSTYLHEIKIAMALDGAVTIAIAFTLNRVHHWVERVVDLALFRKKYAAEDYLNRLGPTLLDARREETIDAELAGAPVRALDLTMSAVFRASESAYVLCASAGHDHQLPPAFDADHELVRFLSTGRAPVPLRTIAYESRAELAIPIFQGKLLTGFVLYGAHADGTQLDPDESEALKHLCDAGAQAYISITYERQNATSQIALA
jgi:hypothetical protein